MACGENEEFSTEASACANTCSQPNAEDTCKAEPAVIEACVCKAGFLRSGDKCVPDDEPCGCKISDQQFFEVS